MRGCNPHESMKGSEQLDLSPRHKPSPCRESVYSLPDACLPDRPKLLQLLLQGHLLSSILPFIHCKLQDKKDAPNLYLTIFQLVACIKAVLLTYAMHVSRLDKKHRLIKKKIKIRKVPPHPPAKQNGFMCSCECPSSKH